jgi:acyl-coenzyme A thioesterase 9
VRLDVLDQNEDIKMSAMFLMACRQKNQVKGMEVPRVLDYKEDSDKLFNLRQELGKANQLNRKKNSELSLKKHIPSVEEMSMLHDFLVSQKNVEDPKELQEYKLEKVLFAHEQNKNVHGKLFGGNIMRECFEIAYMTAYMLGNGENPELYHIGDTQVWLY